MATRNDVRAGQLADVAEKRLAERNIEMHRSVLRGGEGAPGERSPARGSRRVGDTRVVEPAHGAAVEVALVDRLGRSDVAQLGRSVGGDDQHRDVGQPGFDDCREEVGGCRAARAQQGGRRSTEPQTEGDEGGGPLVVDEVQLEFLTAGEGEGHRRAARSGCHHGVADTQVDPLVDERGAERRLDVSRAHVAGAEAPSDQTLEFESVNVWSTHDAERQARRVAHHGPVLEHVDDLGAETLQPGDLGGDVVGMEIDVDATRPVPEALDQQPHRRPRKVDPVVLGITREVRQGLPGRRAPERHLAGMIGIASAEVDDDLAEHAAVGHRVGTLIGPCRLRAATTAIPPDGSPIASPSVATAVRIEVYSDVVCPWCYIGKRRLDRALDTLADEPDFPGAEVVFGRSSSILVRPGIVPSP